MTGSLVGRLFVASRPLSWINTAFPFAAAVLLQTGQIDVRLVVGTVFFLVPYNVAMYGINDVFDYASDAQNPRKGGVEGALLEPRHHTATLWAAALVCVPFIVWLAVLGSPLSWLVLAISMFAVAAYSVPGLRFKEIPLLDSVTSATHFVSPAIYGLVLVGTQWTPGLVAVIAAFFCWGTASHAFGAVQDVVPDRAAGIGSIATALGAAATVRLAIALWSLAGIIMLVTGLLTQDLVPALAAALVLPYLVAVWPFRSVADSDSGRANRGWRRFLAINYVVGFFVTMLCIAVAVT